MLQAEVHVCVTSRCLVGNRYVYCVYVHMVHQEIAGFVVMFSRDRAHVHVHWCISNKCVHVHVWDFVCGYGRGSLDVYM